MKSAERKTGIVLYLVILNVICLLGTAPAVAQQEATEATEAPQATSLQAGVPRLVRFAGTAKELNGTPLTGVVGITFALYSEQTGGATLWLETQNVTADSLGHYTVLLGSTKPDGLPAELFTSGQARWVGVQVLVSGQAEQPRVLLVSAPYALKAGDAATIGGLPPSAFVLAAPSSRGSTTAGSQHVGTDASTAAASAGPAAATDVTTTGGTANYLPVFNGTSTIIDSAMYQSGTGSTAKLGIGTLTPGATLDVNGAANVEGLLTLPASGVATASGGKSSQPQDLVASSYSSTTSAAVNQTFQWKAEAEGNDTSTPSGTLNLLFGSGTSSPVETGLELSNKGLFTFATGQTFPGTGTITGITTASGSGLAGGGTKGTLSLSVPAAGIVNTMLQHPSLTLTAGGGMTGGGSVSLGGAATLGLKTCGANQLLEYIGDVWTCANAGGTGTITGITTASGSGLTGGGTTGTLSLSVPAAGIVNTMLQHPSLTLTAGGGMTGGGSVSLGGTATLGLETCGANQVLEFIGSAWTCSSAGTGTITGVTAGFGLNGGGTGGNVPLSVNTAYIPQLIGTNFFSGEDLFSNSPGTPLISQNECQGCGYFTLGANLLNFNSVGAGVLGQSGTLSNTGSTYNDTTSSSGVWADNSNTTASFGRQALLATADDANSVFAINNSPSGYPTIFARQNGSNGQAILAESQTGPAVAGASTSGYGVSGLGGTGVLGQSISNTGTGVQGYGGTMGSGVVGNAGSGGGGYGVFSYGNMGATGTKTAIVVLPDDRMVSLYAMESPENWFEDFGSGRLANGVATIELDSTFAQTVSPEVGYYVFLTPNGDCEGLYVTQKTAAGFEVRELRAGKSSAAFDYRIVAKRKGLESLRMEDVGADHETAEAIRQQISLRPAHSPKLVLPKPPEHAEGPTPRRALMPKPATSEKTPQAFIAKPVTSQK